MEFLAKFVIENPQRFSTLVDESSLRIIKGKENVQHITYAHLGPQRGRENHIKEKFLSNHLPLDFHHLEIIIRLGFKFNCKILRRPFFISFAMTLTLHSQKNFRGFSSYHFYPSFLSKSLITLEKIFTELFVLKKILFLHKKLFLAPSRLKNAKWMKENFFHCLHSILCWFFSYRARFQLLIYLTTFLCFSLFNS